MIKSRTMLVVITGDMVQYIPTGRFSTWILAEDNGAPEWVGHYLKYNDFDLKKEIFIKKVTDTNNYVIEQKK